MIFSHTLGEISAGGAARTRIRAMTATAPCNRARDPHMGEESPKGDPSHMLGEISAAGAAATSRSVQWCATVPYLAPVWAKLPGAWVGSAAGEGGQHVDRAGGGKGGIAVVAGQPVDQEAAGLQ